MACSVRTLPAALPLILVLVLATSLDGQSDSATVTPGRQYAASELHRRLLGEGYRDLWTTPLRVEVLDLEKEAGGLTAIERGGGVQTIALRFRAADGQEYNFRSIDKELTPALPPYLQETLLDWVRQDVTSAQMPVAPMIATPLLDAVGILNPAPRLVVLPDHPALGEFREEFGGMFGTFEHHASEIEEGVGGFAGSVEVKGTEGMLDDVEDDPVNRVDARSFLTARLVDMLIGDWDRHGDQWRWGRYDRDGIRWWVPIPEDRDYAFVDYGGVLLELARRVGLARLVAFGDRYSPLTAMMANSLELNRRLLAELPQSTWDSTAIFVQSRLTDAVIADAVARTPPELRGSASEAIETKLRSRRDSLREMARSYYLLMAGMVEVHSTDADEVAEIERRPDGSVDVAIRTTEGSSVFHRLFLADQTQEVRIDLHGGNDRAVVRGGAGPMVLRIFGGGGDDRLEDSARGPSVLYDFQGDNELIAGRDTRLERRPYEPPADTGSILPSSDRDWGSNLSLSPQAAWRSHAGVVVGGGVSWTRYGFRADPFLTRHEARGVVAPLSGRMALEYSGHFRRENSARWTELRGEASNLNAVRFHGFGNAREDAGNASRVWLRELILEPRWHLPLARGVELVMGAGLKYTDPSFESDAPVAALGELGSRPHGQVQARGAFALDRRDNPWFPRKGAEVQVTGLSAQPVSGVDFSFSKVEALASTYITVPIWTRPVFALRGGGARLWGDFPFHEAAFLGGSNTIRGYQRERFAGDAMLFGNAELRVPLVELELLARGHLGVSGLVDAGRVYFDGESPGGLHRAAGGSLWFVTPDLSLSVTYAWGDSHRLDADLGLPF